MKRIQLLLLFSALFFCLTGCSHEQEKESLSPAIPTPKNHMETITVYSVDPDSLTLVPVSVKKGKEAISEKYIISLVLSNLIEYQIKTPVLRKKGKRLYVSFFPGGEPVKNCNRKLEKLILECFANSLLDNIESCHDIIFQVNGRAYKSDNFEFGPEEIYLSR